MQRRGLQLAVELAHEAAAVPVEAGELERLAVQLLHVGQLHAVADAAGADPQRRRADADHARPRARLLVMPEHDDALGRIVVEQHGGLLLRAFGGIDLLEGHVLRAERGDELRVRGVLRERPVAADRIALLRLAGCPACRPPPVARRLCGCGQGAGQQEGGRREAVVATALQVSFRLAALQRLGRNAAGGFTIATQADRQALRVALRRTCAVAAPQAHNAAVMPASSAGS